MTGDTEPGPPTGLQAPELAGADQSADQLATSPQLTEAVDDSLLPAWEERLSPLRDPLRRFITLRWAPLVAALLSLALSVVAIYTATQQPQVLLILPHSIRVAQGRSTGAAYVYFQPAFVNTGQNDRVEVVRDMTLRVQRVDGSTPPSADFQWTEVVNLLTDPATGALTYQHDADAVPIVISAKNAAAPLSLFQAPSGWFFAAGTYTLTLTANRVVASAPVTGQVTMTLSADNVTFLDQPGPDKFLMLTVQ